MNKQRRKSSRNRNANNSGSAPKLVTIPIHVDDRGQLSQLLGSYARDFPPVKRVYTVSNFTKGTIRGFHMHRKEWKAFYVLEGAAKFVIVSTDFKQTTTHVLSRGDTRVLIVPPQLYHGWVSLMEKTTLIGFSNVGLSESEGDDYRIDPMRFGAEIWEVRPR